MVISTSELRRQAAIRGWDQRTLARQAGVSEATVSRAMAGRGVRGITALKLVQALRRQRPIPELELLVVLDGGGRQSSASTFSSASYESDGVRCA